MTSKKFSRMEGSPMRGMKSGVIRAGGVATALAAVVAAPPAVAAPVGSQAKPAVKTAGSEGWQPFEVPVQGTANLLSVSTAGPDAAWAGGFTLNEDSPGPRPSGTNKMPRRPVAASGDECYGRDTFLSLMMRWDGRGWQQSPLPKVGRVNHVSASRTNDVWASADCGLLHWNGRSWTSVPVEAVPGAQQSSADAVKAVGPENAWLTGGTYDSGTGVMRGIVQRWDGRRWRNVPLPDLGDNFTLDAIDAQGPHDAWAVGTDYAGGDARREQLLLLHWNGSGWKRLPEPPTGEWTNRVTSVRMVAANDVWVSGWGKRAPDGGEIRRPLLLHWDGREWSAVKTPDGRGELNDVAVSGGQALAVGDTFAPWESDYTMYALRRTRTGWRTETVPAAGKGSLTGLAPVPGGGLWGVGSTGDEGHLRPLIARWR
jgi:hypothetical protein